MALAPGRVRFHAFDTVAKLSVANEPTSLSFLSPSRYIRPLPPVLVLDIWSNAAAGMCRNPCRLRMYLRRAKPRMQVQNTLTRPANNCDSCSWSEEL